MGIIYGYDLSYKEALAKSGLSNLYQRKSELCQTFFNKIFVNSEDKLHALLPSNVSKLLVTLRKNRTLRFRLAKQTDSVIPL